MELLAAEPVHLCVVGDDDQSIYQWRGSDVSNIVEFRQRYAPVREFKIETNRRSRPDIIRAANSFGKTIAGRLPKTMREHRPSSGARKSSIGRRTRRRRRRFKSLARFGARTKSSATATETSRSSAEAEFRFRRSSRLSTLKASRFSPADGRTSSSGPRPPVRQNALLACGYRVARRGLQPDFRDDHARCARRGLRRSLRPGCGARNRDSEESRALARTGGRR